MKNRIALILIADGIIDPCQSTKSDSFDVIGSSGNFQLNFTFATI